MPTDARKSALDVLNILDKGHRTLDSILEEYFGTVAIGSRQDRALFQALVYGVLRWRGRLDYLISHFSSTRFTKINPNVLNILRLALFQIIYLDRIPDSAAVNTAVELAKTCGAPWVVGYVNALLRKAARAYPNVSLPDPNQNAVAAMAVRKSFPEWIIRKWMNRYGSDNTASLCDSLNTIPPITVRTNTLKASRGQLAEALGSETALVSPTCYAPDGITFINPATSIPELSAFKAGWFQVQDEAAQLVSLLLDPQPGDTVLDACAGLGGKTGHIAQLMKNEGVLVALDVSESKLLRLKTDMPRLDISILSTINHNLERKLPRDLLPAFDRILLDAPCSGLGVMRRNPDIKWRTSKRNLAKYKTRQIRLLENLSHLVKPSGILVYAVCSSEPEENKAVVNEFLKNHDEFVISKQFGQLPDTLCSMADVPGVFKTFPHLKQMDGFYAVRLQRNP
ncbi:16S rRNA (cytosine(967)-C(5))-methyltransferase (EC [Olavius sp. associated proteobacterium Delta 1]|nr:16S rRNA (cytosine(967)-C(5))-methyltransferase (EC [Olavius sp. associated proteobacterium Delta 1]